MIKPDTSHYRKFLPKITPIRWCPRRWVRWSGLDYLPCLLSPGPPKVATHIPMKNLFLCTVIQDVMHHKTFRHIYWTSFNQNMGKKEVSSLISTQAMLRRKSTWETSGSSLRRRSTPTADSTNPKMIFETPSWFHLKISYPCDLVKTLTIWIAWRLFFSVWAVRAG